MKLADVKDDSRAACYLKKRRQSPGAWPAVRAWPAAKQHAENIATRAQADTDSGLALAEMWGTLGHKEPKKFSPEGVALTEARATRTATRKALGDVRARAPWPGKATPGGHNADSWYYLTHDDGAGVFRDVRDSHDVIDLGHSGWFTDPESESFNDGSGLCWGVVARLSGRDGAPRYLAGYQFGGMDSGVSISLATVYADSEAAARAGDSYAENMAEKEKEFQEAARAGQDFADHAELVGTTRRACLQLMKERKAARDVSPGIRDAVRAAIRTHLHDIRTARKTMAELAGQYWDAAQKVTFCESANLENMPA